MDNVPQSSATASTAASSMGSSTKSGDGSERDLLEFDEIDPDIEREVGAHAPIPVQQEPSSDAVPFRCGQCGKTPEILPPERQLKRCIQCRHIWYCSVECQRKHWPLHKDQCRVHALELEQASRAKLKQFAETGVHGPGADGGAGGAGSLFMFGSGMFGVLGNDRAEENALTPYWISTLESSKVSRVSLGSCHAVCTTKDGQLYAWGANDSGQLGHGDRVSRATPQPVVALDVKTIVRTAAGFAHTAAVTSDGHVLSFGGNDFGQLGVNTAARRLAALAPGVPRWDVTDHVSPKMVKELSAAHIVITQIACGDGHTLCLTNTGSLYAFGDGSRGATGLHIPGVSDGKRAAPGSARKLTSSDSSDKTTGLVMVPTLIDALGAIPIVGIAAGSHHSLAVSATGSLYSWGSGKHGASGHGRTEPIFTPQRLKIIVNIDDKDGSSHPSSVFVHSVAAGGSTSAALTIQGELYTWGANQHGQLGIGNREDHFVPVKVPVFGPTHRVLDKATADVLVTKVTVGVRHMAVVTSSHEVYTWGAGDVGQLGHGSTEDELVPRRLRFALPSFVSESRVGSIVRPSPVKLSPGAAATISPVRQSSEHNPVASSPMLGSTQAAAPMEVSATSIANGDHHSTNASHHLNSTPRSTSSQSQYVPPHLHRLAHFPSGVPFPHPSVRVVDVCCGSDTTALVLQYVSPMESESSVRQGRHSPHAKVSSKIPAVTLALDEAPRCAAPADDSAGSAALMTAASAAAAVDMRTDSPGRTLPSPDDHLRDKKRPRLEATAAATGLEDHASASDGAATSTAAAVHSGVQDMVIDADHTDRAAASAPAPSSEVMSAPGGGGGGGGGGPTGAPGAPASAESISTAAAAAAPPSIARTERWQQQGASTSTTFPHGVFSFMLPVSLRVSSASGVPISSPALSLPSIAPSHRFTRPNLGSPSWLNLNLDSLTLPRHAVEHLAQRSAAVQGAGTDLNQVLARAQSDSATQLAALNSSNQLQSGGLTASRPDAMDVQDAEPRASDNRLVSPDARATAAAVLGSGAGAAVGLTDGSSEDETKHLSPPSSPSSGPLSEDEVMARALSPTFTGQASSADSTAATGAQHGNGGSAAMSTLETVHGGARSPSHESPITVTVNGLPPPLPLGLPAAPSDPTSFGPSPFTSSAQQQPASSPRATAYSSTNGGPTSFPYSDQAMTPSAPPVAVSIDDAVRNMDLSPLPGLGLPEPQRMLPEPGPPSMTAAVDPALTAASATLFDHSGYGSHGAIPMDSVSSTSTAAIASAAAAVQPLNELATPLPSIQPGKKLRKRPGQEQHACRWLPRLVPPAAFQYWVFTAKLRSARLTGDFQPLAVYISTAFSQPSALNASFLPSALSAAFKQPSATDLRIYRSGVDPLMVERFYKTLLSLRRPELNKALFSAIVKALSQMVTMMGRPGAHHTDEAGFRCLAIVLQCPLLARATLSERALLHDLCSTIRRLSPTAKERLKEWWALCYPADIFGARLVGTLMRHLHHQLKRFFNARDVEDSSVQMVEILKLLKEANDSSRLIPAERFYVKDLAVHVDLATDYIRWSNYLVLSKQPQMQRSPQQIAEPFSFCRYNFLIDPLTKSRILRLEHIITQAHQQVRSLVPVCMIRVRRSHLMEDALPQLSRLHADALKKQLQVEFIGEQGMDAGGLTQELFEMVTRELMKPAYGLFVYNEELRTYWYDCSHVGASPEEQQKKLDLYRTAGVVVGTACFHGVSIHANFPSVLYKKLLGHKITLDDLKLLDPVVGNSLQALLDYDGPDVENVFCLDFTASTPALGAANKPVAVELIPGGASIPVTNENRKEYVNLMVDYLLHRSVKDQEDAFMKGFLCICDGLALRHLGFTPGDLELIINGSPVLDFKALERSARYDGGYHRFHPLVRWFWEVCEELTLEQRQQLLYFCTGSARSPLGGLGELTLTLQRAGPDSDMVPTSHVCFHMLLVPEYSSKDKLKRKLLTAIAHSQGFGLH